MYIKTFFFVFSFCSALVFFDFMLQSIEDGVGGNNKFSKFVFVVFCVCCLFWAFVFAYERI